MSQAGGRAAADDLQPNSKSTDMKARNSKTTAPTGPLAAVALAASVVWSAPAVASSAYFQAFSNVFFLTAPGDYAAPYDITVEPQPGDCAPGYAYNECFSLSQGSDAFAYAGTYQVVDGSPKFGGSNAGGFANGRGFSLGHSILGWKITTTGTDVDVSGFGFDWNISAQAGVFDGYGEIYGFVGWQLLDVAGDALTEYADPLIDVVIASFEPELLGTELFDTADFPGLYQGSYTFDDVLLSAGQTLLVYSMTGGLVEAFGVPEPATLTLLGAGLAGVAAARRKRPRRIAAEA